MSKRANQGSFCKSVCWLIGLVVGGYAAFALVSDFQLEAWLAGVIGIVTMLLLGFVLRRIFCRGHANRVRERVAEAKKQAEAKAPETLVVQARTPRPEAAKSKPVPQVAPKTAKEPAFEKPAADAIYDALNEKILAATTVAAAAPVAEGAEQTTAKKTPPPQEASAKPGVAAEKPAGVEDKPTTKTADIPPQPDKNSKPKGVLTLKPSMRDTSAPEPTEATDKPDLTALPPVEEVMKSVAEAIKAEMTAAADSDSTPPATDAVADDGVKVEISEKVESPKAETATPEPDKPKETSVPEIKPLRPRGLEAAEGGTPDDLTEIEGINAEIETALQGAGIYHYSQFVTMNRRELAWLDANIPGAEKASAEGWRKQAIMFSRKAG
jgi:predicted flap endonuclease-1-like 5' DNA nuclease